MNKQYQTTNLLMASLIICTSLASPSIAKDKAHLEPQPSLVPPPPPVVVPSGFNTTYPMATPVEYMSESDLKTQRQDVVTRLEAANSALAEKEDAHNELQKRATLFVSLLEEGVVSKHELQSAQKESERAEQEYIDAQKLASDLGNELSRIDAQLAKLAKAKVKANKSKKQKP